MEFACDLLKTSVVGSTDQSWSVSGQQRPSLAPLFSHTYKLLFPQPLYLHNLPNCPGVTTPSCTKTVQLTTNLFPFISLRTLLRRAKYQPACFHRLAHSFAKTPGWGLCNSPAVYAIQQSVESGHRGAGPPSVLADSPRRTNDHQPTRTMRNLRTVARAYLRRLDLQARPVPGQALPCQAAGRGSEIVGAGLRPLAPRSRL